MKSIKIHKSQSFFVIQTFINSDINFNKHVLNQNESHLEQNPQIFVSISADSFNIINIIYF